jgi:hypothetical protein
MQAEEEIASSSMMDPWSIFLYGMKAPMTREKYRGRLAKFFDFIGLTEGTMEERAKTFTERGQKTTRLGFSKCSALCTSSERKGCKGRDKSCNS